MYEGKVHTLFLRFAVPQMLGLLCNSVYTIVDGVFIGNRLGREAMAAAAVAVPVLEVLIALAIAIGSGAGVLISMRLSQEKPEDARQLFQEAFWLLSAAGIVIALLGNFWLRPLTGLLGATVEVLEEAMVYLRYIVTFAPFQLLSFLLGGMARNDDRPKLAMTALMLGAASNIVLDYVFMYPLNMGISGAALATALGPIFSVLILLPHFLLKKGNLYFTWTSLRLREVRLIFLYGFPSFIMEFSIGTVTFLHNFFIVHYGYGEAGLAAYLIMGYLMLIILTLFLGLAEGLQPVFSYFSGLGNTKRNQEIRRFSTLAFLALGLACYGAVILHAGRHLEPDQGLPLHPESPLAEPAGPGRRHHPPAHRHGRRGSGLRRHLRDPAGDGLCQQTAETQRSESGRGQHHLRELFRLPGEDGPAGSRSLGAHPA